jgi:tetratricopeptide (TPR) repeat protein
MSYKPEERDDFDFGKRIYKQKPKNKAPLILTITLVVLLASIVVAIIYKESKSQTSLADYDTTETQNLEQPGTSYEEDSYDTEEVTGTEAELSPNTNQDDENIETGEAGLSESEMGETELEGKNIQVPHKDQFNRANKYWKAKEYEKALPILKDLSSKYKLFFAYVAYCYYIKGEYASARDNLEEALKYYEKDAYILALLSWTCWKLDDIENSLRYAEEALKIKKDRFLQALYNKIKREGDAMDGYGKAERVNFNIVFSKIEHSDIRVAVTEILEEAYHDIGQELDAYPSNPVSVILYNSKNFSLVTGAGHGVAGLFDQIDGKIRIPIRGLTANEPLLRPLLFHEYTHALVFSITRKCPRWLQEGLAEYFEHHSTNKTPPKTIGQWIPLKYLSGAFFHRDRRVVFAAYWQSYSLVYYLVERYKLYRIKELLEDLSKGVDLNTAFSSAFSISFDHFAKIWEKKS